MGVGGPIAQLCTCQTVGELIEAAHDAWAEGLPWVVLGGGSNIVAADDPFEGTVIAARGGEFRVVGSDSDRVVLEVDAGMAWDDLVATAVDEGWSGLEALSGIPGSVGAAPIQNIGAYGAEFADVARGVGFLPEGADAVEYLPASECEFGYRTSVFKRGLSGVVCTVRLEVSRSSESAPVGYAQLAHALGVDLGDRVPLRDVREHVLELRSSKGMVFRQDDVDSHGCGSFFVNPVVPIGMLTNLPADSPFWPVSAPAEAAVFPLGESVEQDMPPAPRSGPERVKLSAAWLIEHSGIRRGFCLPGSGAAVSSKHTLAITNRGSASANDVLALARFIQTRVASEFGVVLHPEPILVGFSL